MPAAARFSILLFYNRIFSIHERFRIMVIVVGIVNLMWWIGCTVALIWACIPVNANWNPLLKGRCIDKEAFFVAAEVPDSLLDFIIMALPISVLKTLQMPLRQKINIGFVFVMGGL